MAVSVAEEWPLVDARLYPFNWLPTLVNFLVILGSQHPFSFDFYFRLI